MAKKVISIIVAAILLFAFYGCSQEEEPTDSEIYTQTPTADINDNTNNNIEEDQAEGDVNIEQNIRGESYTANDGNVILRATISVPQIVDDDYVAAADIINTYYQEQQDKHAQYAEQELYEYAIYAYTNSSGAADSFTPYTAEQFFTVELNSNGYLSIFRTLVESAEGNYSELSVASETFEMTGGGLVTGAYLYTDEDTAKERVLNIITETIESDESGNYYQNASELACEAFQSDCFYLTTDGIVYYFQMYELGYESLGVPEFLITYEQVKDIFNLWQV